MDKLGTIYKIKNSINNKVYIGQTTRDYKTRIREHKYKLNNGTHYNLHLQNAWNKYGEDSFIFEPIEKCCVGEMDKLEKKHINNYMLKGKIYNIEPGGNKIKKLSESTKQKIGEQSKKPVILVNTGETFNSINKAAEKYGVLASGISDCCNGAREHAGRLPNGEWMVWRHKEHYDKGEKVSFKKSTANNKKKVICINTMEIFDSGKEAGMKHGINPKNINSCCRGERKSCFSKEGERLQFKFYEEGASYSLAQLREVPEKKAIICLTTGEKFDSIYEGAKKYNIDIRRLSNCCKGRYTYAGELKDGTKLIWKYA